MYNPLYVANNFLMRSFDQANPITPMKLQKMLYFLYRDYLQETKEPLFVERFMAWKYGPVLDSIYHEFKQFGSRGIKQYGGYPNDCYLIKEDSNQILKRLLDSLWGKCSPYDGIYLSKLTHLPECAWYKAWTTDKILLEDSEILTDTVQVV